MRVQPLFAFSCFSEKLAASRRNKPTFSNREEQNAHRASTGRAPLAD